MNHTCLFTEDQFTGCNNRGDFSCDFKFERSLYRAGFKTKASYFFGAKYSSYSKGCANDVIPDFHIVSETASRPRLNVGHVSRQWEIFSSGHWDGPLGGGNDKLRTGLMNSWMFNHKISFLFHEAWLKPENCKKMENVVPECDKESQKPAHRNILLSLTDGYAYHMNRQTFCKLTDDVMIDAQKRNTYMRDYPRVIKAAASYSEEEWERVYRSADGGFGRSSCTSEQDPHRCDRRPIGPDGLEDREPNNDVMMDRENYCETCTRIQVPNFFDTGETRTVVECRLPDEVKQEVQSNTNMDLWGNDKVRRR
jgi:hypothetical protein